MWSLNCKRADCGRPLLATDVVGDVNRWMSEVVAATPDGTRLIGTYDGYGGVGQHVGALVDVVGETSVWHMSCWELEGRPGYSGPSKLAEDQGYFFDEGKYDIPDPMPAGTLVTSVEAGTPEAPVSDLLDGAWHLRSDVTVTRVDLVRWLVRYRRVAVAAGVGPLVDEPAWLARVPRA